MVEMGRAEQEAKAEVLRTSPLMQRLDRRNHSLGVINLQRSVAHSTALPSWIVQRSVLLDQLHTRYSIRDNDAAGGLELPLATASPAPLRQPLSQLPESSSAVAIAPSNPVETQVSNLPPAPLQISRKATPVSSSSSIAEPDQASITQPETAIQSALSAIASSSTAPVEQYRIRRISANPATQSGAIAQRHATPDESSTATSVSTSDATLPAPSLILPPAQAADATIAPQPPATSSAAVDDRPQFTPDPPVPSNVGSALHVTETETSIRSIPIQAGGSATDTMVQRKVPQLDDPQSESVVPIMSSEPVTAIAQASPTPQTSQTHTEAPTSLPLVNAQFLPTLVQRQAITTTVTTLQSNDAASNRLQSEPRAIAPARSISQSPIQPTLVWRQSQSETLPGNGSFSQISRPSGLPLAIRPASTPLSAIARQIETPSDSAIATASSAVSPGSPPVAPIPARTSNTVNIGQIAEQVSRILYRQLTVERERRGMNKWS